MKRAMLLRSNVVMLCGARDQAAWLGPAARMRNIAMGLSAVALPSLQPTPIGVQPPRAR